jgi:hypothetical protein
MAAVAGGKGEEVVGEVLVPALEAGPAVLLPHRARL